MKKNLMRLCCLVLALVMALSMAACGKSGDASEAAPSGSAKKPAATAAPEFVYAAEFKPLMEKSKDWMSVREYNEETKATILVSSHNLQHTVDICPRIALLEHGVIIRDINNSDGQAQRELEDYFQVTD